MAEKKTAQTKRQKKKATGQPGPKADLLKLEGSWRDAVKKSLAKKKPADGWPK